MKRRELRMVQEAIEVHCEGENIQIPTPSSIKALRDQDDYVDGAWINVDIKYAYSVLIVDELSFGVALLKF